jgi:signal transduction histidine kinase
MNEIPNARYILSIFAARAGAEIQRVKSKELLREQTRRLSETNQMKDRVLALIAHDLKNPLHTILGFSELLKNKSDDYSKDQLTKRIEIIDNSIKNLYCFLENLIDWSKLQRDTLKPKIEEFNIHAVIEDNIELFQYIIQVKSIKVNNKIPGNQTIKGDKYYMNSIIRNLLSNAIIYNYKKGNVDISMSEGNGCITFAIADQGIGIAKDEKDDILGAGSPFKNNESKNDGGTGLGLVISKTFIEKQGGKIWYTSTVNSGTTFYFTIPG